MQPLPVVEADEIDITVTTEEVQVQPDETFPLSVEVANRTQFILSGVFAESGIDFVSFALSESPDDHHSR
jgi:hypothetical protein